MPLYRRPAAGAETGETLQVQKKKIWEAVQPDLKTDSDRQAGYKGMLMQTSAGSITSGSLASANIS